MEENLRFEALMDYDSNTGSNNLTAAKDSHARSQKNSINESKEQQ
jgi:hypothetical protein